MRVGEARLLGARHFESVLLSCRPGFEVEGSRQSTRGAGQAQGSGCEGWAKDVGPGVCVFGEVFRWSTLPGQRPHTMAPSSPRLPLSPLISAAPLHPLAPKHRRSCQVAGVGGPGPCSNECRNSARSCHPWAEMPCAVRHGRGFPWLSTLGSGLAAAGTARLLGAPLVWWREPPLPALGLPHVFSPSHLCEEAQSWRVNAAPACGVRACPRRLAGIRYRQFNNEISLPSIGAGRAPAAPFAELLIWLLNMVYRAIKAR